MHLIDFRNLLAYHGLNIEGIEGVEAVMDGILRERERERERERDKDREKDKNQPDQILKEQHSIIRSSLMDV